MLQFSSLAMNTEFLADGSASFDLMKLGEIVLKHLNRLHIRIVIGM